MYSQELTKIYLMTRLRICNGKSKNQMTWRNCTLDFAPIATLVNSCTLIPVHLAERWRVVPAQHFANHSLELPVRDPRRDPDTSGHHDERIGVLVRCADLALVCAPYVILPLRIVLYDQTCAAFDVLFVVRLGHRGAACPAHGQSAPQRTGRVAASCLNPYSASMPCA